MEALTARLQPGSSRQRNVIKTVGVRGPARSEAMCVASCKLPSNVMLGTNHRATGRTATTAYASFYDKCKQLFCWLLPSFEVWAIHLIVRTCTCLLFYVAEGSASIRHRTSHQYASANNRLIASRSIKLGATPIHNLWFGFSHLDEFYILRFFILPLLRAAASQLTRQTSLPCSGCAPEPLAPQTFISHIRGASYRFHHSHSLV